MVLRVRPISTQLPTGIPYFSVITTFLHSIPCIWCLWRETELLLAPARVQFIDSRAYVISLNARWPIRTIEWWSRPSGQRRFLFTQSPEHERHLVVSFRRLYIFLIHFPASFIRLWLSYHFDLRDRDMAGSCSLQAQVYSPPFYQTQLYWEKFARSDMD